MCSANLNDRIVEISNHFTTTYSELKACGEELKSLLTDFLESTYHGKLAMSVDENCLVKLSVTPVSGESGTKLYGQIMPYQINYYKIKKDGAVSNAPRYAVREHNGTCLNLNNYLSIIEEKFTPTNEDIPR